MKVVNVPHTRPLAAVTVLAVLAVLTVLAAVRAAVLAGHPPSAASAAGAAGEPKGAASQPAGVLWDGNESVAQYAKRAGIADVEVTLKLDANVTMRLALAPAGRFPRGSPATDPNRWPDESPRREVTISRAFYVGVYEVTQEQYKAVTGNNPSRGQGATRPANMVSWDDAVAYCGKLSQKIGGTARLPTEAEWEYACRAGAAGRYCFGDDSNALGEYGWFVDNSGDRTHPVGERKPNAWGLHDVHGNVWEWCQDLYADNYADGSGVDPRGAATGANRVLRGGSEEEQAGFCRSAYRNSLVPDMHMYGIGFRVVVELK